MLGLEELYEINKNGKIIEPNPGITHIGYGVDLFDCKKKLRPINIEDRVRSGQMGVFGTTRVGKSRLLEHIVEQDIKKGYNVVVLDPKGDTELFSKVVQSACEAGRLDEIMLLTPIYPDHSIKLDPLANYYILDELVDHVVSGIKAKEDYFIAIASEVTQAIVTGLAIEHAHDNKGIPLQINFNDIKHLSDHTSLKDFKTKLALRTDIPELAEVCSTIDQIVASSSDYFAKVAGSLRTTLTALSFGNTGKIIGKSYVNEFVRRFENNESVILYCNTGALLARRTAHIVGRVLISMIQSMVGRFFSSGRKLNPPLCIHMDEGHNALFLGVQELFNKAGGANAWVTFYTQSLAQMTYEVGPEATGSIMDNFNTTLFFLVNNPETAQYMEDLSPFIQKGQAMLQTGGGITLRNTEEKRILAHKVTSLEKRYFYLKSYSNFYKGITADVSERYVDVEFPDLINSADDIMQTNNFYKDAAAVG